MISSTIDRTLEILGLSNRGLARLIGVDVHTITENKEKSWDDLTPMTRKKLGAVCILVVQDFFLYRAAVIHEILNLHVFKDSSGQRFSVLSALSSEKFDLESVVSIGKLAEQAYKEKESKTAFSVPELADAV